MEVHLRIPDSVKLLPKKQLLGLSPKEKEKYYDRVIADILEANPAGVSALEIERATGFYGRTVRDHLEKMVVIGKVFSVYRSGVAFFFPSGTTEDEELTIKSETRDGVFYVVSKISNQRGKFYYIQQKEMDDYRTLTVKGGITIAEADARAFITHFHTYIASGRKKE